MTDPTRGCTATRFTATHPYVYEPVGHDCDDWGDWELCGQPADAPIHQVPAAEQTPPGWTTTPAGYLVPADLDDDPRLWTGEPTADAGQPTGGAAPAADANDFYLRLSDSLHLVAEQIVALAGQPDGSMFATLSFWPNAGSDAQNIDIVDALGRALLGRPGELQKMSNGTYHHDVTGHVGDLQVTAYRSVDPPQVRAQRDEVAALKARIAELESRP